MCFDDNPRARNVDTTTNIALNLGILDFDKAEAHLASENYLTLQARLSLTQSES